MLLRGCRTHPTVPGSEPKSRLSLSQERIGHPAPSAHASTGSARAGRGVARVPSYSAHPERVEGRVGNVPASTGASAPSGEACVAAAASLSAGTGTPSRYVTRLPGWAGTRSPGERMPDQVQRVHRGQSDRLAGGLDVPEAPQQLDRLRQRELLADEARNEPPAAYLAARLQPPQDAHQLAPRRRG